MIKLQKQYLTQFSTERDEVEDVVPGEPGSGLDVVTTRKFAIRNCKIRRLLPGLALRDPLHELDGLLPDCICVLKRKWKQLFNFSNGYSGNQPGIFTHFRIFNTIPIVSWIQISPSDLFSQN